MDDKVKQKTLEKLYWEIATLMVDEPKDRSWRWWAENHGDEEYYMNERYRISSQLHIFCGWIE